MKRKKLIGFIISGILLLSSSNVIAAQSNTTDTLDIEKSAIETIKNSQSLKTISKQTDNANKRYADSRAATQSVLAKGKGNLIQSVIINPIEAKYTIDKFATNKEVNINSVILVAYSKYIALLKANYATNIQKDLTDNLEQDNKNAQLNLANGLITLNVARLAEINYLKSEYRLYNLQNSLDSAYMAVNLAMGEDIAKRYTTLMDYNIVPANTFRSLDDFVKGALLKRGEIVNAQNTLDAKKMELNYEQYGSYNDYQFHVQQAQYNIDNLKNSLEEAKITVQLEINNGYKLLEGYMKAMEGQQANYDLAESNYESAKIQYNNSMITLNQFQDVEISKSQAQMNLKNAQLDAWLEQTKMNRASDIGPALN